MYTEKTNIDDLLKTVIDKNSQNSFVEKLNESKQLNLISNNERYNSVGDSIDKILHDAIFENANKSIEKIRNKLSNFSESFENKPYHSTIPQHDLLDKIKNKFGFDQENEGLEMSSFFDKSEYENIPDWIITADFNRTETDLIAKSNNNKEIIFSDYFTHHDLPPIITQNGLLLKGSTLKTLAGSLAPNKFAQVSANEVLSIGEVSNTKGIVKALRLDGNIYKLSTGDPIFKGDVIETGLNSSVGLTFLDKTTLSLSESGKMLLDELVYDPATGAGDFAVDMLEGAFSFVSGEIAKTGEDSMTVTTPVATIGIRGTTVAGKAAVEGNENSFTLLQDAGGEVGEISISNSAGTQTLSQVGATTSVSSFNAQPPPPIILSAAEIQANYGTALDVLPPTPAIAPQPQPSPSPQEESQTSEEESETDGENEDSEESSEEDEITEENETDEENEEIVEEENNEEDILEGDEELIAESEENPESQNESIDDAEENSSLESDSINNDELGDTNNSIQEEGLDELIESAAEEQLLSEQALSDINDSELLSDFEDLGGPGEFGANLGPENIDNEVLGVGVLAELGDNEFGGAENQGFGIEPFDSFGAPGAFGTGIFMNGDSFGIELSSESSFFSPFGEEEMFMNSMIMPGAEDNLYGTGFGDIGFMDGFIESYDSYDEEVTDEYFEDPSLYEDYETINSSDEEESEASSSSSSSTTGTTGNDTLTGTNANDTISGLAGNDYINGNEGDDILDGNDGLDTIRGGDGNDTIKGGDANDTLYGGLGNDIIYGGLGADTINGGNGIDTIYGGTGSDTIKGGLGYDNFVMTDITDAVDTITDFEQGDRIVAIYNPSHPTFTRSGVEHVHNTNFTYDIDANGNNLPNFLNFTYNFDNIPSGDYSDPTEVSKGFEFNFYDSNDYYDASSTVKTDFMILTGDGTNSAMFHWDDQDYDGSFHLDDSELTLMGTLENFENDILTSNELTVTLPYGA